jgi:hypothetical protein
VTTRNLLNLFFLASIGFFFLRLMYMFSVLPWLSKALRLGVVKSFGACG